MPPIVLGGRIQFFDFLKQGASRRFFGQTIFWGAVRAKALFRPVFLRLLSIRGAVRAKKQTQLGQFFTEWGIDFNDSRIGSYSSDSTHKLIVAVNGEPITDVANYVLKAHDEIDIWYGDKTVSPSFIRSYNFPTGE